MKTYILILLFGLLQIPKSKTILLKMNNNDCANCYGNLYFLQEYLKQNKFQCQIILEESEKNDSLKFRKKYNLTEMNKSFKTIYSDSIYQLISKNDFPELIIHDSKSNEIYRAILKYANLKLFSFILGLEESEEDYLKLAFKDINIENTNLDANWFHIYLYDDYGFCTIYNFKDKSIKQLDFTPKLYKAMYASVYGKQAQERQKTIQYLIENNVLMGVKERIQSLIPQDDSVVDILGTIPTVEVNGNDTLISSKYFLVRYNFYKDIVLNSYSIPDSFNRFYLNPSPSYKDNNGNVYFSLLNNNKINTKEARLFIKFKNTKNGYENFEILQFPFPQNLIKYNLFYNFFQPNFTDNIASLLLSDSICNLSTNKAIKIPLPDSLFQYTDYFKNNELNIDFIDDKKYAHILSASQISKSKYSCIYNLNKENRELVFNDEMKILEKNVLAPNLFYWSYFLTNQYLIAKKSKENFYRIYFQKR